MSDPTPAEMGRRLDSIMQILHRIEDRMTPRNEFDAHVRETDRRLSALEATKSTAHAEIHTKIAAVEARAQAEVEKLEAEVDVREVERQRWARDANLKVWVALGSAALALLGTVVATVVVVGLGVG